MNEWRFAGRTKSLTPDIYRRELWDQCERLAELLERVHNLDWWRHSSPPDDPDCDVFETLKCIRSELDNCRVEQTTARMALCPPFAGDVGDEWENWALHVTNALNDLRGKGVTP